MKRNVRLSDKGGLDKEISQKPLFKSAEAIHGLLHSRGGGGSASSGLWQKTTDWARRRHIKLNAYPVEKANMIDVHKGG
jgi:hypothetical protein